MGNKECEKRSEWAKNGQNEEEQNRQRMGIKKKRIGKAEWAKKYGQKKKNRMGNTVNWQKEE